jgi:hypothetical protein
VHFEGDRDFARVLGEESRSLSIWLVETFGVSRRSTPVRCLAASLLTGRISSTAISISLPR